MGIFAELFAALAGKAVVDHSEKKAQERKRMQELQSETTKIFQTAAAVRSEREYLESIPVSVDDAWEPITVSALEGSGGSGRVVLCRYEYDGLNDENKQKITRLLRNAEAHNNLLRCHLDLIHTLQEIGEPYLSTIEELMHNEMLFIMEHVQPRTPTETMIRKVCCFRDAEYYFMRGQFVSALKRLYESITWPRLLDNNVFVEDWDDNGLSEFYCAAVTNIINIYALIRMPEKADETRRVFQRAYRYGKNNAIEISSNPYGGTTPAGYHDYMKKTIATYDADLDFVGFQRLSAFSGSKTWSDKSVNMFDRFVISDYDGVQTYMILFELFYECEFTTSMGRNFQDTPALYIKDFCTIQDLYDMIEKAKSDLDF